MQVLVAEDSPVYRKLVSSHLEAWGFSLVLASDGAEAWNVLQKATAPKLIVLDWVLPGMNGIDICRRVRQSDGTTYPYIIILTGKSTKKDVLQAMEAGADDYLTKPFDELELKARLGVGKRVIQLQEELASARDSMRHSASHDQLTGVLNRTETFDTLTKELDRARRDNKPVSVMLADIDNFRELNDTCGQLWGDEVLRELARRFRAKLRVYDSVGRYGGGKFLLVLPGCDVMTALIRADQIRSSVAEKPFVHARTSRTVTLSIGVAVAADHSAIGRESLLLQAEQGVSSAKRKGCNRVEQVEPTHSCKTMAAARN